jgi:hypothetical protein
VGAKRIPEDIAAAIMECRPDGVIEEFDTEESYFHDVHAALTRDLRKISGAALVWQTEAEPGRGDWDDDDDAPPPGPDFQSYHVFFLAPHGSEFEFETEIESMEDAEDPEDPGAELKTVTYPGTGQRGCSAVVSLVTPFAAVSFADYARFEDGSDSTPDPFNSGYYDDTGKPVDMAESYRNDLGESAFAKLENLWDRIAKVLPKHGVIVLDRAILDLPAPDLRHASEVFLDGKELSVGDAFFFRGV